MGYLKDWDFRIPWTALAAGLFAIWIFSALYYAVRMYRFQLGLLKQKNRIKKITEKDWQEKKVQRQAFDWTVKKLWLPLVPIAGPIWWERCMGLARHSILLNGVKTEKTDPTLMNVIDSDWVLIEEQFDHISGDHHGSRLFLLDPSEDNYQFYSTRNFFADQPENGIRIKYLFQKEDEIHWATMEPWPEGCWTLKNQHGNTVIPVCRVNKLTSKPANLVDVLPGAGEQSSKVLVGGETFSIQMAEFQLHRLPRLAVFKHAENFYTRDVVVVLGEGECQINRLGETANLVNSEIWVSIKKMMVQFQQKTYIIPYYGSPYWINPGDIRPVNGGDKFHIQKSILMVHQDEWEEWYLQIDYVFDPEEP